MTSLPPALIFIIGAILIPLLPGRWTRSVAFLVFPALTFVLLVALEPGMEVTLPFMNYELVVLRVDKLSLVFSYVFAIITFIGGFYGFHLKDRLQQSTALLYSGSALGVVFAGDLFTLLVFWEIMAASSVFLIWARRTEASRKAGMRYLMVHLFGGALVLAGIMLHISDTGSILFNHFEGSFASYLILIGFAINAAIPPLHAWLADAYPEGTVTGSVFLSAFTTKTAIYVLARGFSGTEILIWAGAIMALYGVVFAVLENDIRRLLAYHIISQVGYMVAGVGMGTELAINGASAHAFAHILYKALLFMGAGAVLYSTGKSKLSELGGLARKMPVIFWLYMIGAFSISGFPLFSGFVSKSMVIAAAEHSHLPAIFMMLSVASVGTFLHTGLKLPYFTWLGPDRGLEPKPIPRGMYIGMALAAILCIAVGVYPTLLYNHLPFAVDYHPYTATHVIEACQYLFFTALGFWLLIKMLGGEATITMDTDWFYRRPARLAYQVFVALPSRIFVAAGDLGLGLARWLTGVGANPAGCVVKFGHSLGSAFTGKEAEPEPAEFSPDRYRINVGFMLFWVMLFFVVLFAWGYFCS